VVGGQHVGKTLPALHLAAALRDFGSAVRSVAFAAVAPSATMSFGFTASISPSSHWEQASISRCAGVLCRRRLPRGSHLKCFTALVT